MTAAAYSCQLPYLLQEDYDAFNQKFWEEHIQPGNETGPESRGAHAAYLSRILAANKTGYFVGDGLTIAGGWLLFSGALNVWESRNWTSSAGCMEKAGPVRACLRHYMSPLGPKVHILEDAGYQSMAMLRDGQCLITAAEHELVRHCWH